MTFILSRGTTAYGPLREPKNPGDPTRPDEATHTATRPFHGDSQHPPVAETAMTMYSIEELEEALDRVTSHEQEEGRIAPFTPESKYEDILEYTTYQQLLQKYVAIPHEASSVMWGCRPMQR